MSAKLYIIKVIRRVLSDTSFSKLAHYYLHFRNFRIPKYLNLKKPKTFNEKIIYLKLFNRFEDAHLLVDKYEVREYIRRIIGEEYLVPLIGVYNNVNQIDFSILPNKFVIKANQSSGLNLIIKDVNEIDHIAIKRILKNWLTIDYSDFGEWQYRGIQNKIIIEKFIENSEEDPLLDYKFFCFNGVPKYIQVDVDRETNHTRKFFDLNWTPQEFSFLYPQPTRIIKRPHNLETMVSLVNKISTDLSDRMIFVRVDFYDHNGQVFFGEITFHPGGGCEPVFPKEFDLILGKQLKL